MKKISVLITLLVLSLVLSGCTKVEYNLVVTKDDVSYKGTVGFSKEFLAQLEEMGEATEGEAEPEGNRPDGRPLQGTHPPAQGFCARKAQKRTARPRLQ